MLYSGLCILRGLTYIKKRLVYGAAIINKRRYWPPHINGDKIKSCFTDKGVMVVDALFSEPDNVHHCVFAMKEEDNSMILMYTYG